MSFPSYPEYKDSGHDWLGVVPMHWAVGKFRHYFTESPAKIEDVIVGQMLSVSGYRGIEIKDYDDENRKRSEEELVGYRVVRRGQLVVNTMWLNYAGLGVSDYEGHVSPAYRSYWISDCLDKRFTHHLMRSGVYVLGYTKFLTGIRPNSLQMSRDDLMVFPVLIPSEAEQTAIATFLDHETAKIDALVAEQEWLIELLKEKRQAVISHAVTKGLDPSVPMKDSGVEWLGDVPVHWETTRLKHATELIVDCPHETPIYSDDGDYLVIRTADIFDGVLCEDGLYRVAETEYLNRIRRQSLLQGDVVYGREGERWGHAAIVPRSDTFCLGQRMMQFRMAKHFDPEYMMWLLNSEVVYRQGQQDTVGATSPHVNVGTIRNYALCAPPLAEQRCIGMYLSVKAREFDALIEAASAAISLLQERRTALISAAVTGQIDVRGLASSEAAA